MDRDLEAALGAALPDSVLLLEADGTCVAARVTAELETAFGLSAVVGGKPLENNHLEPAAGLLQAGRSEPAAAHWRVGDGAYEARLIPAPKGRILCLLRDVTALRSESQVADGVQEELEQLAYSTAHDLREPVRVALNYLCLLRDEADLDEEARDNLAAALSSITRMQGLLEAIWGFVRLSSLPAAFEPVALDEIVAAVVHDLELELMESGGQIEVGFLPKVVGQRTQLRRLFENLLANALKYRGDNPPRIDITARPEGRFWRIGVRDGGVGFHPRHAERIFGMFERLDRSGPPGAGMGLALCRSIVRRHGGVITATGEPGRGATFSFTLPAVRS